METAQGFGWFKPGTEGALASFDVKEQICSRPLGLTAIIKLCISLFKPCSVLELSVVLSYYYFVSARFIILV